MDTMLVKTLQDMQQQEHTVISKPLKEDDDEDALYCRSIVPIVRELPVKKRRLAKVKISELLYQIEFETDLH